MQPPARAVDIPVLRLRAVNAKPLRAEGQYVLYWMIAARRARWNFALERASHQAINLRLPLVVFEPLRCGYRWASDRLHRFVIEGMRDNAAAFARPGVAYYPYLEPQPGAGKGLLAALAERAAVVVTDDFPAFFLPNMIAAAGRALDVRLEAVDSNGLAPLRVADRAFTMAHSFRRFLQKTLRPHLDEFPLADPLAVAEFARASWLRAPAIDPQILARWPRAPAGAAIDLTAFPIDHGVAPSSIAGGAVAAERRWRDFLRDGLARYVDQRNEPDADATSGLSPYLHFGHFSPHQAFSELMAHVGWSPDQVAARPNGKRAGWWGATAAAEAFLDELITWRELGYNMCAHAPDYDQYESLPAWAQKTLADHARDPRPAPRDFDQLERAESYDPLWNAAQRQLTGEGRIHNYLRMLWGKKILEWSPSPREALAAMIELNNKYALDGRDPNSYSGIFWTLGRYDRAWGPERPIFGKVRYMTSENTARKWRVREYLARYGGSEQPSQRSAAR